MSLLQDRIKNSRTVSSTNSAKTPPVQTVSNTATQPISQPQVNSQPQPLQTQQSIPQPTQPSERQPNTSAQLNSYNTSSTDISQNTHSDGVPSLSRMESMDVLPPEVDSLSYTTNQPTYQAQETSYGFNSRGSLLQGKVQTKRATQQEIQSRIDNEILTPTDKEQQLLEVIQRQVAERFRDKISKGGIDDTVERGVKNLVHTVAEQNKLSFESEKRIEKIIMQKLTGLGVIESFRLDPSITEIIVERYDRICIERNGRVYETNAKFTNEDELLSVINRIIAPTGRTINIAIPMVDSRLSDGSRVNATIPPATPDGATLTIRKFPDKMLSGQDYLDKDSLSPDMLLFLQKAVEGKLALVVSGGTGAGKTSLLNMLSQFIPNNELIVTIEDSLELKLQQPHVRRMEARVVSNNESSAILMPVTPQTMVKNALRMRPDRIIIGEVRDGTIVDMLTAASTGHDGTMSTIHANSPENLVDSRLPILFSMNKDANFSESTQKLLFQESIDLIVQINRMPDHSRKITKITHVTSDKNNKLLLQDIFVYSKHHGKYISTGYVPTPLLSKMQLRNIELDRSIFNNK